MATRSSRDEMRQDHVLRLLLWQVRHLLLLLLLLLRQKIHVRLLLMVEIFNGPARAEARLCETILHLLWRHLYGIASERRAEHWTSASIGGIHWPVRLGLLVLQILLLSDHWRLHHVRWAGGHLLRRLVLVMHQRRAHLGTHLRGRTNTGAIGRTLRVTDRAAVLEPIRQTVRVVCNSRRCPVKLRGSTSGWALLAAVVVARAATSTAAARRWLVRGPARLLLRPADASK